MDNVLKYDDFLQERDDNLLMTPVFEMAVAPKKMSDKYGEVVGSIADNLICICLYPDNPTVPHWKERTHGLCKRFIDLDINPNNKNTSENRLKCLMKGVVEELNEDFSALRSHFRTVSIYYSSRPNPHDRLTPVKPYQTICDENFDRVVESIKTITGFVSEQDYEGLIEYMSNF